MPDENVSKQVHFVAALIAALRQYVSDEGPSGMYGGMEHSCSPGIAWITLHSNTDQGQPSQTYG
jgi:hypothetical protein